MLEYLQSSDLRSVIVQKTENNKEKYPILSKYKKALIGLAISLPLLLGGCGDIDVNSPSIPPTCSYLISTVNESANGANLSPSLVFAQIYQESGCNPNAISSANAIGVAQIILKYHPEISYKDALNYQTAIAWQANYMSNLINKRGGNIEEALKIYNCGEAGFYRNQNCDNGYANNILKIQTYIDNNRIFKNGIWYQS